MVWICWRDVYVLLGEIQKTCFWRRRLSSFFKLTFIYEHWLVITASWEHLVAVVFVSNKFMSSCVICLVIAREIFLLQSDCSATTKVHIIFRYWAYFIINLFCKLRILKQTLKMEDTLYKLDISRHKPICGLFPAECQFLRQTFRLFRLYHLRNIFTAFAVGLSG